MADSTAGSNCHSANGTPITDGSYNISDDGTCGFSQTNNSKPSTDPKLDPRGLRDNGGPTETIALQRKKSKAAIGEIPKGQNGCGTEIKTDQRGLKRPQGVRDRCEIGAYEMKRKR